MLKREGVVDCCTTHKQLVEGSKSIILGWYAVDIYNYGICFLMLKGIRMIVDNVYNELNDMKSDCYTKREFSRDYLGKCGSYYSAIKTKKSDISKTALVNLWHKLRHDVTVFEETANKTNERWMKRNLMERKKTFDTLSKGVLEALIDEGATEFTETRTTHV